MPFDAASARSASITAPLFIAEVEFGQVALQMMTAHMVIGSDQPRFHDREVTLDRVGMSDTTDISYRSADILDHSANGYLPNAGGP